MLRFLILSASVAVVLAEGGMPVYNTHHDTHDHFGHHDQGYGHGHGGPEKIGYNTKVIPVESYAKKPIHKTHYETGTRPSTSRSPRRTTCLSRKRSTRRLSATRRSLCRGHRTKQLNIPSRFPSKSPTMFR